MAGKEPEGNECKQFDYEGGNVEEKNVEEVRLLQHIMVIMVNNEFSFINGEVKPVMFG
jgi:hypothetical protein